MSDLWTPDKVAAAMVELPKPQGGFGVLESCKILSVLEITISGPMGRLDDVVQQLKDQGFLVASDWPGMPPTAMREDLFTLVARKILPEKEN